MTLIKVMTQKKLLTILLVVLSLRGMAGEPQGFPIIADILHTELYDAARFRDIRDAGFNACLCRCATNQDILKTLKVAEAYNLKLIIFSHPIMRRPGDIVPIIKDHPSMWQYYLQDEPTMNQLKDLQTIQQHIARYDKDAKCYINLLPNSGKQVLKAIGVEAYPDYLRAFSTIRQPQISYDFYPVQGKVVRGDVWYKILDDIRAESHRTGRPFWAYILCVPHFIYPMPTMGHLRLQCYANLAYGAQGIQYFAYATPAHYDKYDFHDGPLLRNGKKSHTYKLVKKMNEELKPVASLFWQSKVTDIEHRKCLDGNILVSHFQKGDRRYTCFVNKSADKDVTVSLRPGNYAWRVRKNLKKESVKSYYKLSAGDILIMRDK